MGQRKYVTQEFKREAVQELKSDSNFYYLDAPKTLCLSRLGWDDERGKPCEGSRSRYHANGNARSRRS